MDAAIQKITSSMNKLGAEVAKVSSLKFEPIDAKLMARDLDLINRQMKQAIALSPQLRNALKASGQSGLHLSQIDWSKTSTDPRAAQRLRDRAYTHAVRGSSLDFSGFNDVDEGGNIVPPAAPPKPPASGGGSGGSGGGGSGGRRPPSGGDADADGGSGFGRGFRRYARGMAGRAAGAFGGGVGGPVGGTLQEGIQGAGAGMEAGGLGGGLMGGLGGGVAGLLGGGAIAVAGMAGKAISEGMDQASSRSLNLDTLKRSMGDLGVSFDGLSDASWKAASGLGVANGEFVKMEQLANSSSGGAYRTPDELAGSTREGVDLARAYGLQPAQGVSFVSGMQRLDSRQNNKELAASLAEAIVTAQGKATPAEVAQAMQGFAAAQNRFNSGAVDLDRFGNAYGSMLNGDMTAEHASSILGQANSAMQQMGGTEASKNFTMQAFGSLDPIRAAMRAEGGLFGNGLDNRDIAGYMSQHGVKDWGDQGKGPDGTNFGVVRAAFDKAYAGRGAYGAEMELDAEKNYFGLKSYADTSSFMNMSDSDHNGIGIVLKNAGLSLKDVREGGLQALAGISKAGDFKGLDSFYRNGPDAIRNRSDMSDADKSVLDNAEKSGNFQQFQNELVRVLAGKGQEDDAGSTQRSIDANISDMKTMFGERLIPYTQAIMQGVIAFANKIPGINVQNPEAEGGSMFVGPLSGAKAPNTATGRSTLDGGPGASASRAPGGSTVGGNGGAKYIRPGTTDTSGDDLAGFANGVYGATIGGAYEVNDSVIRGMNQLAGMGIDKDHSAAIMASAIRESSMNPAAKNGNMYGLFQFDRSRQADFQKVMGKDIHGSIAQEQIDYMVRSMRAGGEEAGPGKEFWASSAKDAAGVFARKIERTDHPGKESDIRSGIARQLVDSNVGKPPAKVPARDEEFGAIIEIPPKQIPEKYRAANSAVAPAAAAAALGAAANGPNGDIVINLNQNVQTATGRTRTKKLSTKISLPSPSGLQTPTIIELPGTN